jgi:hypothetical protein
VKNNIEECSQSNIGQYKRNNNANLVAPKVYWIFLVCHHIDSNQNLNDNKIVQPYLAVTPKFPSTDSRELFSAEHINHAAGADLSSHAYESGPAVPNSSDDTSLFA